MKRFLIIAILLVAAVVARAENEVSLNSPSGAPGDTVEVVLSMTASDACVAMQAKIALGKTQHYVAGSATLAASRISDHELSATMQGDTLRIYSYSLSLTPYSGEGELIRFKVVLGEEPGTYPLEAGDLILSDAGYSALEVTATGGELTVLAPKIALSATSVDYGHYPIRAEYTRNLTVSNSGNMPMTVSRITFDDTTLSCAEQEVEIEGGSSAVFTLRYNPVVAGQISRTAVVHSTAKVGDSVVSIVANPFAVNELHIENASGYTDSIITISLRMNNMDSIVGVQTSVKLPSALTYVEGSFTVNEERGQGHQAAAGMNGDTLTMLIYSTQNKPLTGADGVIATFRVKLFGYNYYYLYPKNTVLSDTNEVNVVSAVYNGRVQIYSPYLSSATTLDMGSSPLPEPVMKPFGIKNTGNAPLIVDNVVFTADDFAIRDSLPLTLAPYSSDTLHVEYSGMDEGGFGCTMRIYSNDANNTMRNVTVSGRRYEPNAFYVETEDYYFPEEEVEARFMLENYSDITALQFDYSYPYGNYTVEAIDFELSERANGQSLSAVRLNDSTFRLLVYSMQNNAFHGNEGAVAKVTLHPIDTTIFGTYWNRLSNVVVSNMAGDNKLTDLTDEDHFVTHPHCTDTVPSEAAICDGEEYMFYGEPLTATGSYEHREVNNVCDTLYVVALTVNPTYDINQSATICEAGSYSFAGNEYSEAGEYTYSDTTEEGCDSVVTLQLTVVSNYQTVDSIESCDQYTWVDGNTYTEDNNSAIYETTAQSGCDSVVTLNLTMHYSVSVVDEQEVCDSLVWIDGNGYTEDNNTAYYVAQTAEGCDSAITLNLSVRYSVQTTDEKEACDSYMWIDGETYTQSESEASYTFEAANGCDSTITLNLTMHYSATSTDTVEAEESYVWNGTTYEESGVYEYQTETEWGCDSTAVLVLTITDDTEGIDDIEKEKWEVRVNGKLLRVENATGETVEVFDLQGRVYYKGQWYGDVELPAAGVYMVRVGEKGTKKIVCR